MEKLYFNSNVNVVVWGQVKSENSSLPVTVRVSKLEARIQKPYPILWPESAKFDTLYMTKTAEKPYPLGPPISM